MRRADADAIRRLRAGLLVLAFLGISLLAWWPKPLTEMTIAYQDKLEHVLAFLVLYVMSAGLWPAAWLMTGWAAYAGAIELGQEFLPGRTASAADWLASLTGILAGAALAWLWGGIRRWLRAGRGR